MTTPRPAHDLFGKRGRPGLVCVNGLGATRRSWWPLVRHLVGSHRILLYDHRGTGGSTELGDASLPTLADYREDLRALVEDLELGGATFLGFSFGGRVCIDLALAQPELVGALALVSTSAGAVARRELPRAVMDAAWQRFEISATTWAGEVMPELFGPEYLGRHQRVFERLAGAGALAVEDPAAMARQWLAIANLDVREELGAIACPCLIVQGGADRLCPPSEGRELAARIPGARLVLYPELGHVPHIEQPGAVARDLAAFLEALAGGRGS